MLMGFSPKRIEMLRQGDRKLLPGYLLPKMMAAAAPRMPTPPRMAAVGGTPRRVSAGGGGGGVTGGAWEETMNFVMSFRLRPMRGWLVKGLASGKPMTNIVRAMGKV